MHTLTDLLLIPLACCLSPFIVVIACMMSSQWSRREESGEWLHK